MTWHIIPVHCLSEVGPRTVQWSGRSSLYRRDTWRCPACCAGQASTPPSSSQHHPPPKPPAPSSSRDQNQNRCHFLQFSTNGILNSRHQLLQLLQDRNILIACIQETKLTETYTLLPFSIYAAVRKDRPQGRGGWLITLIHHSKTYKEIRPDPFFPGDRTAEHLTTSFEIDGTHLQICNVYIPLRPHVLPATLLPSARFLLRPLEVSL